MNDSTYFVLGERVYNTLKWVVKILLPAVSAAYFALGALWGFNNIELVVGTIAIVTTFIGALLGVSTVNYNKLTRKNVVGEIVIPKNDMDKIRMALDLTPDELMNRNAVIFKIRTADEEG